VASPYGYNFAAGGPSLRDPRTIIERRSADFSSNEMIFHLFGGPCLIEDVFETNVLLIGIPVLGQNGSGQNGTDKMVWTKWHGQNGTDKILRIKSSLNPAPIDNMIFS